MKRWGLGEVEKRLIMTVLKEEANLYCQLRPQLELVISWQMKPFLRTHTV